MGGGQNGVWTQGLVRLPGNTRERGRSRSHGTANERGWWAVQGLEPRQDWDEASHWPVVGNGSLGRITDLAEPGDDSCPHRKADHGWPAWAGMNSQPGQGRVGPPAPWTSGREERGRSCHIASRAYQQARPGAQGRNVSGQPHHHPLREVESSGLQKPKTGKGWAVRGRCLSPATQHWRLGLFGDSRRPTRDTALLPYVPNPRAHPTQDSTQTL